MRYLYSGIQAKEIDSHAIQTVGIPGLVLMEKAAMTIAAVIMNREEKSRKILAVCGTGNNGGDGVAAVRLLRQQGYSAAVTVVGDTDHMTEEMQRQLEIAVNCDVPVLSVASVAEHDFDILLDGVFGIGLSREVEGVFEQVLDQMNRSGAVTYSLDVPSGIHAGTGAVLGTAVRADCTITFGVNKLGLVLYPGCEYAGEVIVGDIGFPEVSVASVTPEHYYYEPEDLPVQLPLRPARSHKGTFGRVLVAAGSETMSGAAFLAAKAAYAMGAGLVKVISPACNREILLSSLPEILFAERDEIGDSLDWADAVLVGPGLGLTEEAEELVRYVIQNSPVPTVIDGDGIRLCRNITDTLSDNFIITPHLKEMNYLTGISMEDLKKDVPGRTKTAAKQWNCVVVGKDARTAVSDGQECYINVSGNNGMATGGSGDVLAGLMGGLLAQHMEPFAAAKLAVFLHGLSGDAMAEEKGLYSLMASDLIRGVARITAQLYAGGRRE